jgi:hypothetical protein
MSIVKTVTIIDAMSTKLVKWKFTNYADNAINASIIAGQIAHNPKTARTNVILRGADGKFISYKNKNVEKVYRDAVKSLLPFPKGV